MTGEQISASLTAVGRQLSGWFSDSLRRVSVKKLHNLLCVLLVIWILYGVARLVLVLLPTSDSVSGQPVVADIGDKASAAPAAVDLAALQAVHWFGVAGAAPVQPVAPVVDEETANAEKTQLNLTLEGIVYSPHTTESVAMIVYQGKQDQYYIGDKIPAGNAVSLARVLMDHVIIDNNGTYESLWLYDDSKPPATSPSRSPTASRDSQVSDMRQDQTVTEMARDYQQRLTKNPVSLADVIRIAPEQRDGAMVGYRISPGKDREQFDRLGLKPNDIVTSINNIELNEPSNALEIYKLMRTATEASFTLDRDGERVEIMVSLQAEE